MDRRVRGVRSPAARARRAQGVFAYNPTANGYGTDPDLIEPVVPWQRMMTGRQLLLAAVFSDLMLPATATAPAPSAAACPIASTSGERPYPDQQADRAIVLDGLAWLDAEAERRWRHGFAEATDAERLQILDDIAGGGVRRPTGRECSSPACACWSSAPTTRRRPASTISAMSETLRSTTIPRQARTRSPSSKKSSKSSACDDRIAPSRCPSCCNLADWLTFP